MRGWGGWCGGIRAVGDDRAYRFGVAWAMTGWSGRKGWGAGDATPGGGEVSEGVEAASPVGAERCGIAP